LLVELVQAIYEYIYGQPRTDCNRNEVKRICTPTYTAWHIKCLPQHNEWNGFK